MTRGPRFHGRSKAEDEKLDVLLKLSTEYWAPNNNQEHVAFDVGIIAKIYLDELLLSSLSQKKIVFLEFSQYLEAYLWKNYKPEISSTPYLLSIITMVNEKFRERIPAWECFIASPEHFPFFLNQVLRLSLDDDLTFLEQTIVITFLDNCFNSLEIDIVRQEVVKICSLPIWISLLPSQLSRILSRNPKLKKFWGKVEKKAATLQGEELEQLDFNRHILWKLLQKFKRTVDYIDDDSKEFDVDAVTYCERFLLLLIDLEAQLTTRRFFNFLLLSSHVITHCHLSQFITTEYGSLFCELLSMLKFYARFEIDDVTGLPLTNAEMTKRHYEFVTSLQKAAFKHFPDDMMEFAMLNVGSVDTRKFLQEYFCKMDPVHLYKIANYLELVPDIEEKERLEANYGRYDDVAYLSEMIIFCCERRPSQLQKLNAQPLYPPERVIWDEKLVPYEKYDGKSVLPLNKLNLQFLTLHDYLLRNFNLFQMESTYEIRQDLEDVLFRMRPYVHESGSNEVVWGGWSRMALPVVAGGCRFVWVAKPLVGETSPAEVKADVNVTLPTRMDLRLEWEGLRKNDVLFMVRVKATQKYGTKFDIRKSFKDQFHVDFVRGCEVEGFLGPDGNVVEEMESRDVVRKMTGDSRTIRVKFDPNQYQLDAENDSEKVGLYYTFNLVVRRDPKTNNFKAVLATIRQLLNTECVVPDWLHDLILGYGEPDSAHYTKMTNENVATLNFNDTFLSFDHLKSSFPGKEIVCNHPQPPFKLTFKELMAQHDIADAAQRDLTIVVEPQTSTAHLSLAAAGIEGFEKTRRNAISFTPAQVEAIKSGMQPGLTVVVGPPGTGKTDVAVQIISNIYHNWPEQRTLIVTHSNQALNQLFEKIMDLDVDERHLLRMGHGEEALETEKDFSRYGRVNYVLTERNALLQRVEKLSEILGEVGDVSYSCETAGYFYRYTVVRKWNQFVKSYSIKTGKASANDDANAEGGKTESEAQSGAEVAAQADGSAGTSEQVPADWVANNFPFLKFFGDNLFKKESLEEDFIVAEACYQEIQKIFFKLEEFLAFELLRNGRDRADYLLVKEAKIIAMTCTHAALRRKELVDLGFRYDNILMEESAQILEVETFIPLLLQDPHDGRNRLKRWIMIGDHHQLPPVVQNIAYQKYSNMEQSLFTRFIRLGIPHVELDAQGRARAEIAQLYSWRYKSLGDLPHVQLRPEFQMANPGFLYNFQLIDVPDFNGIGESTPSPYFYQNLGEAEFAVAIFLYMRVLGYPANKISIITTYNGQASLIRDVAMRRCGENPLIGMPGKISTVDKYQGQQNDYIILSLVRTKYVGHLRDIRRLIVALSRARLGLYVLGRVNLFRNCRELEPAFKRLLIRPTRLALIPHESYVSDSRRKNGEPPAYPPMEIVDTQHISLFVHEFYKSNVELLKKRFIDEFGEDALIKAASAAHAKMEERTGTARRKRQPQVQIQRAKQLPIRANIADNGSAASATGAGDAAAVSAETEPMDTENGEQTTPAQEERQGQPSAPAEKSEGSIVFEQVDFERLQEVPKY